MNTIITGVPEERYLPMDSPYGMTLDEPTATRLARLIEQYHEVVGDENGDAQSAYSPQELDDAYLSGYRQAVWDAKQVSSR